MRVCVCACVHACVGKDVRACTRMFVSTRSVMHHSTSHITYQDIRSKEPELSSYKVILKNYEGAKLVPKPEHPENDHTQQSDVGLEVFSESSTKCCRTSQCCAADAINDSRVTPEPDSAPGRSRIVVGSILNDRLHRRTLDCISVRKWCVECRLAHTTTAFESIHAQP